MSNTKDFTQVKQGLYKFARLIPLRQNPNQLKYIQDEFDALEALEVLLQKFHDTAEMFGKKKSRNQPFNYLEDVREEMEEWLLIGRSQKENAIRRKTYQPLFYLIVMPVIELFEHRSHAEVLKQIDSIIEEVKEMVRTQTVSGTYDDAVVMQQILHKEIQQKDAERLAKKRKRYAKQNSFLEQIFADFA
jgi:hypothetical protein